MTSPLEQSRTFLTLAALALGAWLSDHPLGAQAAALRSIRNAGPNALAADRMTLNYYEEILGNDPMGFGLAPMEGVVARKNVPWAFAHWLLGGSQRPPDWNFIANTEAAMPGEGLLSYRLKPGAEIQHKGARVRINHWGMRGPDIEKTPHDDTVRIALIGESNAFGTGVEYEQCYAALLQDRLNAACGRDGRRFEVVNFSVPGYFFLHRLYVLRQYVADFKPRLVLFTTNLFESRILHKYAARMAVECDDLQFDFLREIVRQSGVKPGDDVETARRRMRGTDTMLLENGFAYLRQFSDSSGIPLAVAVMRLEAEAGIHATLRWQADTAERHGLAVLRVFDAYQNHSATEMYLMPNRDHHPTPLAHSLLAENLYKCLMENDATRSLLCESPPATRPHGTEQN